MSWASVLTARMLGLFGRNRQESELDDEVRLHLEMQIEDNLKSGMSPSEARYAAMKEPSSWSARTITFPSTRIGEEAIPCSLANGPSGTRQRSLPSGP